MTTPSMTFTGTSLVQLRDDLILAITALRTEIGTCPNVIQYADDIDDCEAEIARIQRVVDRINKKVTT